MKTTITSTILATTALALIALAPAAASAKTLKPGSYSVQGIQEICLQSGGTWYGETFSGWGGEYTVGPSGETAVFGNYASGVGNDSIIVGKGGSTWNEWRDDLSFTNLTEGAFTMVSKKCSPPAVRSKSGNKNPIE